MVRNFICGSNNIQREEDEYERRETRSAESSPRRSRSKNPYSSRGLDKFSALLVKIEEKRQQIYSQVDPDEISLVRFAYSGDHGFKSIVVKAKPKSSPHYTPQPKQPKQPKPQLDQHIQKPLSIRNLQSSKSMNVNQEVKAENEVNKKLRVNQWKDPKLILVMVILLIMVFLLLFGRSFAIMCTSIGWYFIPTIITKTNSNPCSNLRLSFKKKDYAISRPSHKKLIITSEGTKSFKTSDGLT